MKKEMVAGTWFPGGYGSMLLSIKEISTHLSFSIIIRSEGKPQFVDVCFIFDDLVGLASIHIHFFHKS